MTYTVMKKHWSVTLSHPKHHVFKMFVYGGILMADRTVTRILEVGRINPLIIFDVEFV